MKGWMDNYNESNITLPEGYTGIGYSNKGRTTSPAWNGQWKNGGKLKYGKKTIASALNGKELQFYQQGLDFNPKTISRNGSELLKLEQITNFTNLNKPTDWLSKYD